MDNSRQTTGETPLSKNREQIIKEAQRMEESLLFTSKGHFAAADFWAKFHLWIGIPIYISTCSSDVQHYDILESK
jgi:hypothetical protein